MVLTKTEQMDLEDAIKQSFNDAYNIDRRIELGEKINRLKNKSELI